MNAQRWVAVAAVVLASAGALAQRLAETVQVTLVEVPVTVAGSDGKAVRGLTKEHFELFDDGKRVPVEYFEVLDMKLLDSGPGDKPLPPAATRNFLLFFDLANSSPGALKRAREAALQFVEKQLDDRDLCAVATFTAESGARLVTSFTTDKSLLMAAVKTLGHPRYFKVADPLMISYEATMVPVDNPDIDNELSGDTSGRGTAAGNRNEVADAHNKEYAAKERAMNRAAKVAENTENRNRLNIQLSELGNIARVLDRLHGRKQIILLSEGFDARLVQGREDIGSKKTAEEIDRQMLGQVWEVNSDERYGSSSSARDVNEMVQLFRRSDVVLHAIDIKGLRGNVDLSSSSESVRGRSNESLFLLASPTGGTVFQHGNDLAANFARMLEQQEVVYVLGFNAKNRGNPGKFHSLKVKVNAPGARLSHRSGYFEPSDRMSNLEKTISLTEILMTDTPVNEVGMSVAATALPGAFVETARVPVVVELPGNDFLRGIWGDLVTANLFIYAFDKNNEVKDNLAQRIALNIVDDVATVRAGGIRYFGTLQLPPGDYAIKTIVRVEESNRVGFVRTNVHVPSFESGEVLPPLFLTEPANWVTLAGPARGDAYEYPFNAGDQKYVPRARPVLKSGTAQRLALFLYRVPTENLEVKPELAGSSSAPNLKLLGRTAADEQGNAKLLFEYTPESLQPGDYELRFTVQPKEGNPSVVTLPFRIL